MMGTPYQRNFAVGYYVGCALGALLGFCCSCGFMTIGWGDSGFESTGSMVVWVLCVGLVFAFFAMVFFGVIFGCLFAMVGWLIEGLQELFRRGGTT